jgi:hypothetical protein
MMNDGNQNIFTTEQLNITKMNADAPGQAYLQDTQSRHTKANLAKEPVLFLRFRDILCDGGHGLGLAVKYRFAL